MTTGAIRLVRLTEENFETFASFINCEDGGCYCFSSMDEWDQRKSTEPEKNKACLLERLRASKDGPRSKATLSNAKRLTDSERALPGRAFREISRKPVLHASETTGSARTNTAARSTGST
jgi:hypothetical protein